MKEIKISLGGEKEAVVQVPDDVEIKTEEAAVLVAVVGQEQVANGNIRYTERLYPCFYCGKKYHSQLRLLEHLKVHGHSEKLKLLEHLGQPKTINRAKEKS